MINIFVDESFAYDLRAIAQIKHQKSRCESTRSNLQRVSKEITRQIDLDIHEEILASQEYADLKQANLEIFEIIEKMKRPDKTECYDLMVDRLNYRRFECKKMLQARFFPESSFTEVKLGYGKAK